MLRSLLLVSLYQKKSSIIVSNSYFSNVITDETEFIECQQSLVKLGLVKLEKSDKPNEFIYHLQIDQLTQKLEKVVQKRYKNLINNCSSSTDDKVEETLTTVNKVSKTPIFASSHFSTYYITRTHVHASCVRTRNNYYIIYVLCILDLIKNRVIQTHLRDLKRYFRLEKSRGREITKEKRIDLRSKIDPQDIEIIRDYWNQFRSTGPWKMALALSEKRRKQLMEPLRDFTIQEICTAITNYAEVLQGPKYYWDYQWSLTDFLTVGVSSSASSPRKWERFLEENFVLSNFLDKDYIPEVECDMRIYKKMVRGYGQLTNNREYKPTPTHEVKFKQACVALAGFVSRRSLSKAEGLEYLLQSLETQVVEPGDILYPGHFNSPNTWTVWMPQYLSSLGIMD